MKYDLGRDGGLLLLTRKQNPDWRRSVRSFKHNNMNKCGMGPIFFPNLHNCPLGPFKNYVDNTCVLGKPICEWQATLDPYITSLKQV